MARTTNTSNDNTRDPWAATARETVSERDWIAGKRQAAQDTARKARRDALSAITEVASGSTR